MKESRPFVTSLGLLNGESKLVFAGCFQITLTRRVERVKFTLSYPTLRRGLTLIVITAWSWLESVATVDLYLDVTI